VDLVLTLPCDRVTALISLVEQEFEWLPLTREEEGVGIAAGAALAGRRPAMIVQSSGVGNMLNALLSLTVFYGLPLALFVSNRGIYKEGIAAQMPMGEALPGILDAAGIARTTLSEPEDLQRVEGLLAETYEESRVRAFLMSPALWEESSAKAPSRKGRGLCSCPGIPESPADHSPVLTRYQLLESLCPEIGGAAVVANLGIPSKELHALLPQPSNFYMLGSMGMVTPIGLGVALSTDKRVVVIDGDGSLLMNPGSLATVARAAPRNLSIVAIDNGSYGSTGDQPTLAGSCVDLEHVAQAMGIGNTRKVHDATGLVSVLREDGDGPLFIHALAVPGNQAVPNIPLDAAQIKRQFMGFLAS
jgi:sulfopyruvate decarboxylase subunit beta